MRLAAALPLLPLLAAACVASARTVAAGTTVYAMPSPMTCATARAEALGFRLTPGADSTHFRGAHPGGTTLEVRLDTATRALKVSAEEPVRGGEEGDVPLATRAVGDIGRACGIVTAAPLQ